MLDTLLQRLDDLGNLLILIALTNGVMLGALIWIGVTVEKLLPSADPRERRPGDPEELEEPQRDDQHHDDPNHQFDRR